MPRKSASKKQRGGVNNTSDNTNRLTLETMPPEMLHRIMEFTDDSRADWINDNSNAKLPGPLLETSRTLRHTDALRFTTNDFKQKITNLSTAYPVVYGRFKDDYLNLDRIAASEYNKYVKRSKDLQGADLTREDLQGADLQGANLEGANINRADLRGANLRRANLKGANLYLSKLKGANLTKVNLREADLERAYLQRANIEGANLSEANLTNANLIEANLRRTNLVGADLKDAHLYKSNLYN